MLEKPRILIIGASIAGLTVANGLMQSELCEVIVFERSSKTENGRRPNGGGGIGLHEQSAKFLNNLGVSTEYILPMNIQEDKDRTGRIIRKRRIPFYSAFWGDVHRSLLERASKLGVVVLYNKNVTSIDEHVGGVSIGFSDESIRFQGDCVIGADGILSVVRLILFSNHLSQSDLVRHAGYYAWRGFVPLDSLPSGSAELLCRKDTFTIEISEKSHAIFYYLPEGLNWLIYFNTDSKASSTYHRSDDVAGQITSTVTEEELQQLYRNVEVLYRPEILHLIKASRQPIKNHMYDRMLLRGFSTERCILIGDAAHPTTPHHIRGSNMAIADGFTLAKELLRTLADSENGTSLKNAFVRFENERLNRCNDVVKLSARIGRVRQGVFCDKQQSRWDTFCTDADLSEMSGDINDFTSNDF